MPFNLTIPMSNGNSLDLIVKEGEILFILGANGTGKSSIMHQFYKMYFDKARRLTAHRQTWFSSTSINISSEQKKSMANNIKSDDTNIYARWKENWPELRPNIAIYDLSDAENVRARKISQAVDNGKIEFAKNLSKEDAPIKTINELLKLSNLPIQISIVEDNQVVASKAGSTPYSIAELSDGERNAILIAATILTAQAGTLLLVDEPERHLHRSIISPLLTNLFAKRPDCAFIISTHDVMLPFDNTSARILLIRGCTYNNNILTTYEADLISPETVIDDDLKKDILGARRKLLFIEGTERSLDKPLYGLIFPGLSLIPKSSCRDVEYAVSGIRDADELHWLKAFGIIDNDRRSSEEIELLKTKGIYALSVFSVESIYYHPEIQRRVAERHASVTGDDASTRLANAKNALISAITPHIQRLSERTAERAIREEFFRNLPQKKDIVAGKIINISVDMSVFVKEELNSLNDALKAGDILKIISRYPIRETPALTEIASKLGFTDREQYEGAVRKLLMDDTNALELVRSLFGSLKVDIEAV